MGQATANGLIIYTHPECNYSDAAKDDFRKQGIDFYEIDVTLRPETVPDLERLTGGERITPVIVEGDTVTVGFHGVG